MSTAKEALEERDAMLDEYETKTGIPGFNAPGTAQELESYLNMDRAAIEAMSADMCMSIAYRLGQYAFHIQRAQNREIARVNWAKNEIRLTIANELNNYKGYGYEEKSSQAIKGNGHASKLNQIMVYAQQRADRLNFTANGLKNLSDIMKSIHYNKRQDNG